MISSVFWQGGCTRVLVSVDERAGKAWQARAHGGSTGDLHGGMRTRMVHAVLASPCDRMRSLAGAEDAVRPRRPPRPLPLSDDWMDSGGRGGPTESENCVREGKVSRLGDWVLALPYHS